MKKILSLIMAVIMAVSSLCVFSYAADVAKISGENVNAITGQQIKIPVTITDNTGIMGFKLTVEYDKEYLRPVSVEKGSVTSTGNFNDSIETSKTNQFDIFWNGSENVSGYGTVAYLNFEALKGTDNTVIKLSYSQDDTFDEKWNDVILDLSLIHI